MIEHKEEKHAEIKKDFQYEELFISLYSLSNKL